MLTYRDLIDHGNDFLGSSTSPEDERRVRSAVQAAYRDIPNQRKWAYYYQLGRIATVSPYSTGTISFDFTGGANERMVTLASGTWPAWAALGVLLIDSVPYDVATRVSDTVITLSISSNPGADVAAGTSYTLYRDTYNLPCDFQSMGEIINHANATPLTFVHVAEWLSPQRSHQGPGIPLRFAITADPNYLGTMAVRLWPYPDAAYPLGFIYHRKPRELKLTEHSPGTASTTSGSTSVTGAAADGLATAWTSAMVGSVIRFAQAGQTEPPTGLGGASPYNVERVISAFTSAAALTIDADPGQTLASVKYRISDPVDVEEGAMTNLLLRMVEHHLRLFKRLRPTEEEAAGLNRALIQAFEADSRSFEPRTGVLPMRLRLSDYPRAATFDVG